MVAHHYCWGYLGHAWGWRCLNIFVTLIPFFLLVVPTGYMTKCCRSQHCALLGKQLVFSRPKIWYPYWCGSETWIWKDEGREGEEEGRKEMKREERRGGASVSVALVHSRATGYPLQLVCSRRPTRSKRVRAWSRVSADEEAYVRGGHPALGLEKQSLGPRDLPKQRTHCPGGPRRPAEGELLAHVLAWGRLDHS